MKKDPATARNSYSEKALVYLREQIINGTLHPQEKLIESEIAHALGISRGPVRDALKQLAIEGLVDYQPNKGCTVALISPRDAYEVFFLRGNLEKLALEKSGCHIGDYGIFIMETALDEMRAVAGTENTLLAVNADEKFHRQIVVASQMDRLVKMWELLSPLNGAMFLSLKNANSSPMAKILEPTRRRDLVTSHELILNAVKAGDLAEACRQLDDHYTKNGERVYRLSLMNESSTLEIPTESDSLLASRKTAFDKAQGEAAIRRGDHSIRPQASLSEIT